MRRGRGGGDEARRGNEGGGRGWGRGGREGGNRGGRGRAEGSGAWPARASATARQGGRGEQSSSSAKDSVAHKLSNVQLSDSAASSSRPVDPSSSSSHVHPPKTSLHPIVPLSSPPNRPDKGGTHGNPVRVLANHFRMQIGVQQIFQYSIEILSDTNQPSRISKSTARSVQQQLTRSCSELAKSVFDGSAIMYTAHPLPFEYKTVSVSLPPRDQHFEVHIKLASVLSVQLLMQRSSHHRQAAYDLLQALNIVLREAPSRTLTPLGRCFYSDTFGACSVTRVLEGWNGFFQSVRETQQGYVLNVDLSAAVFYKSMPVLDFLDAQIPGLNRTREWTPSQQAQALDALRGLKVDVSHRDTPRIYSIKGLSPNKTEDIRFRMDGTGNDGRETTIVAFYRDTYGHHIQYTKLHCLQVGGLKVTYLPMEVCHISPGQKYRGHLNENLRRTVQSMSCVQPWERHQGICDLMNGSFSPAKGEFVQEFGVKINLQMTRVPARVLTAPALKYSQDGGRLKQITPAYGSGSWNLLNGAHLIRGCTITDWTVVNFDPAARDQEIQQFSGKLMSRCQELGVQMNPRPVTTFSQLSARDPENQRHQLLQILQGIKRASTSPLPILLCVTQEKHRAYGLLKKLAEVNVGIITQCCLTAHVRKANSQYLANVVLKINGKLGGQNVGLVKDIPAICPILSEPTIIFGADVTHPKPGEHALPSIAAVVASSDWPSATRYAARQSVQTGRMEIIRNLKEMVEELWHNFYRKVQRKPKNVLFFRDGVGEGQFEEVLGTELNILAAALKDAGGEGYNPLVTMVVVQKRHRTRLFPEDMRKERNVAPGTVVDTMITHPLNFDFYLCSHAGIKGTSKPCHYQVLSDQIGFSSDQLQELVYHLCHTYARCTKSVSLIPPAYYAHLAAFRARFYLDVDRSIMSSPTGSIVRLHRDIQDSMFFL